MIFHDWTLRQITTGLFSWLSAGKEAAYDF